MHVCVCCVDGCTLIIRGLHIAGCVRATWGDSFTSERTNNVQWHAPVHCWRVRMFTRFLIVVKEPKQWKSTHTASSSPSAFLCQISLVMMMHRITVSRQSPIEQSSNGFANSAWIWWTKVRYVPFWLHEYHSEMPLYDLSYDFIGILLRLVFQTTVNTDWHLSISYILRSSGMRTL